MSSIRRILVPVDFSEYSERALSYAHELAAPFEASIDVLHVFDAAGLPVLGALVETAPSEAALVDVTRDDAQRKLEALVRAARRRGIVVRSARAEIGPVAATIAAVAATGAYDLVVMGAHGRTGLARALFGSVSESVVRRVHCPVLAVRAQA